MELTPAELVLLERMIALEELQHEIDYNAETTTLASNF